MADQSADTSDTAKSSDTSKPTTKRKLPAGYDDEAEFIQEARERFQQALSFDRENREEAITDLKFLAGEQWTTEDRAAREGLPCLTINRLPQFVAQVVGDIRLNQPAIKVRPAEDADEDLADIRESLIRFIEHDNDAQGVYVSAAESQVACGIGNFRAGLKYATDDGFDRDISIGAIPNPVAVVWDPMSTERTGKDAEYCFVVDEMPRKTFEARYKDEQSSDLEIPQHDNAGWFTQDTVRVTEYWLMKSTPIKLAMLEGGQVVPANEVPEGQKPTQTRTGFKRSACMYLISGKAILDGPFELPVSRLPIFRVRGWEINIGAKRVRFGLVRFAKDPAKLTNYWRSVAAQTIALAPKGKWLVSHTAVPEDSEDDFRTAARTTDPLLKWSGQGVPPEYVPPPPVPEALLQEAALSAQDMKDVTGLHDASLGAQSNETSGKAIMARERQGDVGNYIYNDNLKAAIAECGRVVNELIPVAFDTVRTIRLVGEDQSSKVQKINDPNDPNSIDINQGKYDIVVETGPSYSTRRVEAAESMMQFVQAVPVAAQVAGDLIAKAQDWPMAEEIGDRLQKMLPSALQTDAHGQPVQPPPPSPEQQAVAQHTQQMMAADLDIKKSAVIEAEANAVNAQALAAINHFKAAAVAKGGVSPAVDQAYAEATGQAAPQPQAGPQHAGPQTSGQGAVAPPGQPAPATGQPVPQPG